MRPAVFLDRDGTLIREMHFLRRLEDLEVLQGTAEALARLGRAGYLRLVVTNQSGVARGLFELGFVEQTHRELRRRLQSAGGDVDGFYVCPHHPEYTGACRCRKPAPGLVLRAAGEWRVDLGASWVVGDKAADLELGRNAGCRAALVRTGWGKQTEAGLGSGEVTATFVAEDLVGAVERILEP